MTNGESWQCGNVAYKCRGYKWLVRLPQGCLAMLQGCQIGGLAMYGNVTKCQC